MSLVTSALGSSIWPSLVVLQSLVLWNCVLCGALELPAQTVQLAFCQHTRFIFSCEAQTTPFPRSILGDCDIFIFYFVPFCLYTIIARSQLLFPVLLLDNLFQELLCVFFLLLLNYKLLFTTGLTYKIF